MQEGIKYVISADVKGAVSSLKQVGLSFTDLDKDARDALERVNAAIEKNADIAVKETAKIGRGLLTLEERFKQFNGLKPFQQFIPGGDVNKIIKPLEKVEAGMKKIVPATNSANISLINFGRVVQDAPFGILGIANNIDPLVASFQRLKAETGSTKAAFTALLGSLTGPAGIGIAISAVTSIMIAFGPTISKYISGTKDAKESSDELAATGRDLQEEFTKVDKLFKQTTDSVVKQSGSYKLLTANIKEYIEELGKEVEIKALIPLVEDFVKAAVSAKIELEKLRRNQGDGTSLLSLDADEFEKEVNRLNAIIRKNTLEIDTARKFFDKFFGGTNSVLSILGVKTKESEVSVSGLNKEVEKTGILLKDQLLSRTKLNELTNKDFQKLSEINSLLDLQNKLRADTPTGKNELTLADKGNLDFAGGFTSAKKPLDELTISAKQLSDTINNGIGGGIDTFFNALANNQDPFKALAQSVQRLVVELAAAVVKMLVIKALANLIAPGVGGQAAAAGLNAGILRGAVLGR